MWPQPLGGKLVRKEDLFNNVYKELIKIRDLLYQAELKASKDQVYPLAPPLHTDLKDLLQDPAMYQFSKGTAAAARDSWKVFTKTIDDWLKPKLQNLPREGVPLPFALLVLLDGASARAWAQAAVTCITAVTAKVRPT